MWRSGFFPLHYCIFLVRSSKEWSCACPALRAYYIISIYFILCSGVGYYVRQSWRLLRQNWRLKWSISNKKQWYLNSKMCSGHMQTFMWRYGSRWPNKDSLFCETISRKTGWLYSRCKRLTCALTDSHTHCRSMSILCFSFRFVH